jgi:hypothetical protein
MTSPFAFLQVEWPEVYEAADKAAGAAHSESPFTDLTPHGPDGLFTSKDELMAVLAQVKSAAIAA